MRSVPRRSTSRVSFLDTSFRHASALVASIGHQRERTCASMFRSFLPRRGELVDQPYTLNGLTDDEVIERRKRGEVHRVSRDASRTYAQIVRDNLIALINIALLAIGITLVALQRYSDAIISAGLVLINVGVGMVQEIRAKRRLDKIALLTRPKATVRREGKDTVIDPSEIVRDDVLRAGPGDQIIVDGHIVGDGRIEVDESLLTGETDLIPKQGGDEVHSGSFCVSGGAYYVADKIGEESLAASFTAGARAFRRVLTPLQQEVNLMLRVLLLMTGFFGLLLVIASIIHDVPLVDAVLAGAVIVGLVPPGLFLMITISYALAAIRLSNMDALIQQANAVESLSNVDVLCLDKTGTLTANRIKLDQIAPLGIADDELRQTLGDFAASASSLNKTSEAIAAALPGERRTVTEEIPFSSAWKWSALVLDDRAQGAPGRGAYVLGAPEMLRPALQENTEVETCLAEWAERGLRVLLFACSSDAAQLRDGAGENPTLPFGCCDREVGRRRRRSTQQSVGLWPRMRRHASASRATRPCWPSRADISRTTTDAEIRPRACAAPGR